MQPAVLERRTPRPCLSIERFRLHAIEAYLKRPFLPDEIPPTLAQEYWRLGARCNALMDRTAGGITTVAVVDDAVDSNCVPHFAANIESEFTVVS